MTMSLAQEWGPKGIRANAIAPGPFPTKGAWERLMPAPLAKKTGAGTGSDSIPLRRMGEYHELNNLAVFLLSGQCDYLTGAVIPIDGGQWLASGGNFHSLSALDKDDWSTIKQSIQTTNAKDREARTA